MTQNANISPAAAEIMKGITASLAAGEDPFGDNDNDAPVAADEADENPAVAAGSDDGDDDGDQGAALHLETVAVVDGADDEPAATLEATPTAAPRYKAGDPADFAAQRAALNAEKAKGLKDLMDGVIEPEAYSRIDAEVADKLEAMTVQRTLHEANVQSDAQAQGDALEAIMKAGKAAGVDYTDPKIARRFDAEIALMQADGDNRPYATLAADAHKAVLAIRGVKAAETAVVPAATPRENGKGPMTLRSVPTAAVPNAGGGWQEQIGKLQGDAWRAAYARLSPAQKSSLLDD